MAESLKCKCGGSGVLKEFASVGLRWALVECPKCGRSTRAFNSSRNFKEAQAEALYAWSKGEMKPPQK